MARAAADQTTESTGSQVLVTQKAGPTHRETVGEGGKRHTTLRGYGCRYNRATSAKHGGLAVRGDLAR
jgi:hypothetical protein